MIMVQYLRSETMLQLRRLCEMLQPQEAHQTLWYYIFQKDIFYIMSLILQLR